MCLFNVSEADQSPLAKLNMNNKVIYFLVNLYDTSEFRPYGICAKGASTHRSPSRGHHKTLRQGSATRQLDHYSWDKIHRLASSIDSYIKNWLLLEEHPTSECNRYIFNLTQESVASCIQDFDCAGAAHQFLQRRPDLCQLYLDHNLKILLSFHKSQVESPPHIKWHHVEYNDGIMVWPRKEFIDKCALKVAGTLDAIESGPPSS